MIRRLAVVWLAALVLAAPAQAAPATWSITDLENQLMCPVCHQLLNQSQSTEAVLIRHQIQVRHDQGWSEQRVKSYLVAQYGEEILAAPPAHGFGLLAWVIPPAVLLVGGGVALLLARAWARGRDGGGPPPPAVPGDALDARIDADLAREQL
jgi:cytochrome c-type biogenesis protein CcmH